MSERLWEISGNRSDVVPCPLRMKLRWPLRRLISSPSSPLAAELMPSVAPCANSVNTHESPYRWFKDWFCWLPLALLSWWLAWCLQDPFITDWDAFDYTVQAVEGLPTALGLGRALFLGYNHWLWRAARHFWQWPPNEAYLLIRYAVMAQTGFAVIGFYALYKELLTARVTAFIATALLVAAPFFVIYSGRGMSEIPAFLWLAWALWALVRSARRGWGKRFLLAAFLVGLSLNLREFGLFYFPALLVIGWHYGLAWWRNGLALALACAAALSGMAFWFWYDQAHYWPAVKMWYALSAHEREMNPVTLRNLWLLGRFAFENSPIAALVGWPSLLLLGMRRERIPLLALGVCGLGANLLLVFNHDLAVNPRYLLTGLLGLAGVSAWGMVALWQTHRWRILPLAFGLLVLTKFSYHWMARELYGHQWGAKAARQYYEQIRHLPWHAGFIVGMRTPLISFYAGVGAHPYWDTIASGSDWPDERLPNVIDEMKRGGREMYVDFDPQLWQNGERERSREQATLKLLAQAFVLEKLHDQFYRIGQRKHPLPSVRRLRFQPAQAKNSRSAIP